MGAGTSGPGERRRRGSAQLPRNRDELVRYRQFTAYVQWVAWKQWSGRAGAGPTKSGRSGWWATFHSAISKFSADVWLRTHISSISTGRAARRRNRSSPRASSCASGGRTGASRSITGTHNRAQNFFWWKQRVARDQPHFPFFPHRPCARFLPDLQLSRGSRSATTSSRTLSAGRGQGKDRCGGREPHFIPRAGRAGGKRRRKTATEGEALPAR